MLDHLESLPTAAERMARNKSRVTLWRYLQREPDLGVRIGGRHYLWRPVREALDQGLTMAEAAEIGRACRARVG